jgi:uncharacterized protein DUF748
MDRRRWRVLAGAITAIILIVFVAARGIDEPLRRHVEAGMNAALKGYTVRIGTLRFHPVGGSIDLIDWTIAQDAHPEPPVAYIPRLHASVQWLALVHGRVVADFRFDEPRLRVDLRQLESEAANRTPLKERGWQEAALAIYPFRINLLRVNGGDVTYAEQGPLQPLHVSKLSFRAENIRNVHSRDRTYPSDLHLTALVQDTAELRLDGNADFLAEPYAGVKAIIALDGLHLDYLAPILHHYDLTARAGTLSAEGRIEYAPDVHTVDLVGVSLDRADLEYAKRRVEQPGIAKSTEQGAAKVTQQPTVVAKAERVHITRSKLAYEDQTADPPYRLFIAGCDAILQNFSNVRTADAPPTGTAHVRGKFMGSGDTALHVTFRPHEDRTDFNVALRIENADMRALNDVWRAYGKFDVERGWFSLYSELAVANGEVDGYVKPIFVDVSIPGHTAPKGFGEKVRETVTAGVAAVLKNRPREQIATETRLSGPLTSPKISMWQAIGGLLRNAFFKAILPGLEHERASP